MIAPKLLVIAGALALIALHAAPSAVAVPLTPIALAPRVLLDSMEVIFTWETQGPGVTGFEVEIIPANNDGPGVDRVLSCPESNCPAGYLVILTVPEPPRWYGFLPDMGYTWRVRASDEGNGWSSWTEPATFRTPIRDSTGIEPLLISGASVSDFTPELSWSNSDDDVFYYEVQLSRDSAFNTDPSTATAAVYWNLVHGGISIPKNSWTVPAGSPLEPGSTYYWRVRPRVQGDGTPVEWSATWSFKTVPRPTIAPAATPAGPSATPTPSPPAAGLSIGPITLGLDLLDGSGCVLGRSGTEFPTNVNDIIARYDYQGSGSVTTTWYRAGTSIGATTDTLPAGRCNWMRLRGPFAAGEYRVEVTSGGQLLGSATFKTKTIAPP